MRKWTRRVGYVITASILVVTPMISRSAMALSEGQLDDFDRNGIYYYDPTNNCYYSGGGPADSPSSGGLVGTNYELLKSAVKTYGELAMELQRTYGTPWEVVLAQMQQESSMGTAGHAINGAHNNWLGLTGKGDAGAWRSPPSETYPTGRDWGIYTSVEAAMEAWAGTPFLRNGIYDDAFPHLDPANWDLEAFLTKMIAHYAPSSDGNSEKDYVANVLGFIAGPIKEAREEMGWPSSEELAKNENIAVGGKMPLGGGFGSENWQTGEIVGEVCASGGLAVGGVEDIAGAVLMLEDFLAVVRVRNPELTFPDLSSRTPDFNEPLGTPGFDAGDCWGATYCGQCTAISAWFVNEKTNYAYNGGDGGRVVPNLLNKNPGMGYGAAPRPYAVFSWYYPGHPRGHTGVVVGVLPDESIITIENNDAKPNQLGVMLRSKEFYVSKGTTFAYTGDGLR